MSLLEVRDLRVSFPTADGVVRAVRGVSFDVDAGAGDPPAHRTACHYPVQPHEDLTTTTVAAGPDSGPAGGST